MQIVFCARCGGRLNAEYFQTGEALQHADGKLYHRTCLPSAGRVTELLDEEPLPVARRRPPSSRIIPARERPRKSSRRMAPPPSPGASGRHVSARGHTHRPARSSSLPAPVWGVGGVIGGLLLSAMMVSVMRIGAPRPGSASGVSGHHGRNDPPDEPPQPRVPRETAFPKVGRTLYKSDFERTDLGGFGGHDFKNATDPYATQLPTQGGVLALGRLQEHPDYAYGAGVELAVRYVSADRMRVRFRYRMQARRPQMSVVVFLEESAGPVRYVFECREPTSGRWRWFDEPLTAFHGERVDEGPGQRLVVMMVRAGDTGGGGAYIDEVCVYDPSRM